MVYKQGLHEVLFVKHPRAEGKYGEGHFSPSAIKCLKNMFR